MMRSQASAPDEKVDDDISSKRSDDLLSQSNRSSKPSLASSDPSTTARSATTRITNYTTVSISTSVSDGTSIGSSIRISALRKHKKTSTPLVDLRPNSNVTSLQFDAAGLIGRDEQISELKSCHDRLISDKQKKELVMVAGESGIGKSSLVRTLHNEVSAKGLFVEGKFDMNTSNEPYSGVAKAFGIICRKIVEAKSKESISYLQQDLKRNLGEQPGMLLQLIPELHDIMVVVDEEESPDTRTVGGSKIDRVDETEGGVDRLRFAFRVLTRIFSSMFFPLVLFLDDLQWADVSSLQILEYIMCDTQNTNPLMIVGSYRSDEVDENSLLYNKLVTLRQKTETFQFHITELMVGPFNTMDIEKIISTVIPSSNADDTTGLAALCHKRTLGNPFFTIEFLKMLHFEGMLVFEKSSNEWSWNLSMIEEATMSTANVVVMLEQHLSKLPDDVQALLQCAAYLGSIFREATIDLVWSTYGRRLIERKPKPVSSLLDVLVADDVFEKGENDEYRWAHDKLQEAALSLSGKRRETFQLDIGKTLYYGLSEDEVEEDLFTIVDLINNGNALKLGEFASANLRAAEKAREISAFQSASEYVAVGIGLLVEDDWVNKKSTALGLYTVGAEVEIVLGNVKAAEVYREVVLSRSDLSTLEMLPLQIGKAKALGDVELKYKSALEYCLKLLNDLDCRLAWVRQLALPQAIARATQIIKKAKSKPQMFYDTMEVSNDKKRRYIGYLLSRVSYIGYVTGDKGMSILAMVKLVEMTLEVGVDEFSPTSFVCLGFLSVLVLKDYDAMERFDNIALDMLKKFRGMHGAETAFVGHQMGLLWVKPLESCVDAIKEGIVAGRQEGDIVHTLFCVALDVIILPYCIGRPLGIILEGCPGVLNECEESQLPAHILMTRKYWQMVANLHDPSTYKNPSVLFGKIYTERNEDHEWTPVQFSDKIVAEGEIVFWHEDYEVSAKRALEIGEIYAKLAPVNSWNLIESFHRGVALYDVALRTKQRKYKRAANGIRKRMESWAKYGNTTIQYFSLLLTAEQLALEKKHDEAKLKYEEALEGVGKLGHLHHLGLVNERYSEFLLKELSMEEESRSRLEESLRYYKEWGLVSNRVTKLESRLM